MTVPTSDGSASFADQLNAMTDDELFAAMRALEEVSETAAQAKEDTGDILARIALVENEIEDRYPGQALAPYKHWQTRQ
jgi:ABC-type transporter Mla subunit MlaD